MSVGGALTFPFVALAHPIQHHFRDDLVIDAADTKAAAASYVPEFLDAHQLATIGVLAERIVPGSTKANSAEFIDQLLTVSTGDDQRSFLQALGAFEQLAIERYHAPWVQLAEPQHNALLTIASTEAAGTGGAHLTIRDRFEHLKGWIVGAYYSSEVGMRELGWTGRAFYPNFPGCEHADGHG
jgi:hypothetical protein